MWLYSNGKLCEVLHVNGEAAATSRLFERVGRPRAEDDGVVDDLVLGVFVSSPLVVLPLGLGVGRPAFLAALDWKPNKQLHVCTRFHCLHVCKII